MDHTFKVGVGQSDSSTQAEVNDPLEALLLVARLHHVSGEAANLRLRLGFAPADALLAADLLRAAKLLGLQAKHSKTTPDRLLHTPLPAIALMRPGDGALRVVVLAKCDGDRVLLQDAAQAGRPTMEPLSEFAQRWTGELILVASRASLTGPKRTAVQRILLIHQNFPGQFRHLAPALAEQGHQVVALRINLDPSAVPQQWRGVQVVPYRVVGKNTPGLHAWLTDIDTKLLRARACLDAMRRLSRQGFEPDIVIAHPGWGEALFVKRVWPKTRLGIYAEFFYCEHGADTEFDPEFAAEDKEFDACRLQLKNLNQLAHLDQADSALSPTQWQANTFPWHWRERIAVAHDGIDTEEFRPDADALLEYSLPSAGAGDGERASMQWTREDEVITFVARHLEPYRGFHIFMRALPELLRRRREAQVLIVGDEAAGYGAAAPSGQTWRKVFTEEVRPEIPEADWARVHFLGRLERRSFTKLLQVSQVHVYLSYPFVLSWSLIEAMGVAQV